MMSMDTGRNGPARLLRRVVHAGVYHLLVRPAIRETDVVSMMGFRMTIPPTVFHPKFYLSSRFFAEYLMREDLNGKEVLEMGSGSGLLSVIP